MGWDGMGWKPLRHSTWLGGRDSVEERLEEVQAFRFCFASAIQLGASRP
jgi:hypothetical protein